MEAGEQGIEVDAGAVTRERKLQAFSEFLRRERPLLLRLGRRLCGQCGIDPEDLLQDATERAVRRLERLGDDERTWRSWLVTTMVRLVIDRYRSLQQEERGRRDLEEHLRELSEEGGAPARNGRVERTLESAIDHLSPRMREVYRLRLSGLRYEEIAHRLGVTQGTVGSLLAHGRTELRRILARLLEDESRAH